MSVTEQELAARAVAPRVTLTQVEGSIASEFYFTAGDGVRGESQMGTSPAGRASSLNLLTFCVLVLQNGFTVTGQSACADPANYDPEIGRKIARQNAVNQIWPLLGYELRSKLALVESAGLMGGDMACDPQARTYLGTKVIHASPCTRGEYNQLRGWILPVDESPEDPGYLVEYTDGGKPNLPNYEGYVSWSPKDVFERAYAPVGSIPQAKPTTWLDRAKQEAAELKERLSKLSSFLNSGKVDELSPVDQSSLCSQEHGMKIYLIALTNRIERAEGRS